MTDFSKIKVVPSARVVTGMLRWIWKINLLGCRVKMQIRKRRGKPETNPSKKCTCKCIALFAEGDFGYFKLVSKL